MDQLGKAIIVVGLVLVLLGVGVTFWDRVPLIGRLPGDIHFKRGNVHFYFPIVTSLILSGVLTLMLWIATRLTRR